MAGGCQVLVRPRTTGQVKCALVHGCSGQCSAMLVLINWRHKHSKKKILLLWFGLEPTLQCSRHIVQF